MKDEVPQRRCQGSVLPASCSRGRNQEWRLLAEGADLACVPCGHRGVPGELQEELHFRRLLKVALRDCQVDLHCCSEWCMGQWCGGRNASRENIQLAATIFGTVKTRQGSGSSQLVSEMLLYILWCTKKPATERLQTSPPGWNKLTF